jgi:hypothetical protein
MTLVNYPDSTTTAASLDGFLEFNRGLQELKEASFKIFSEAIEAFQLQISRECEPYHPVYGYRGSLCWTDYVKFYSDKFKYLIKLCEHKKQFFYRKCFNFLKTFRNIRLHRT